MAYAHGIAITSIHTHTSASKNLYLYKVFAWTKQNNLILNPDKTTCTLFTPDPVEYTNNLDLKINKNCTTHGNTPKGSGSYLIPKTHTLSQHLSTCTQASTRWGKQKETLMATYKLVMRPALEYACCCCCIPSETYGRNGVTPIFRSFH